MSVTEKLSSNKEFDSKIQYELERKFIPLFPDQLNRYREESYPLEQFYVSHPSEEFSLRFRETLKDGELHYEATLKDTGTVGVDGIERMEVPVAVTPELYHFYKTLETPSVRKLRSEPNPKVFIDFYDNGEIQLEAESADEWAKFIKIAGNTFADITGDRLSSNEWRAHQAFRKNNAGREALVPEPELDPAIIVADIKQPLETDRPIIVHIGGRSGSGKSTIVKSIRTELEARGISSCVMSTDDYHRGNTWLTNYNGGKPWSHWDDAVVYDTKAMAVDLENLKAGNAIYARSIDWTIVEPSFPGVIQPCSVIILEGIYALSPDISAAGDLTYEMTTPLATCIGRRLLRDLKERPQFADPSESLSYMLREAEPQYRQQLKERL